MEETALPIHRMKSGPLGSDQQIGAMLANGELGLIIFLRYPLTDQPHEPDVSALLRLCDVQKIPLATNASSATIMLESLKNGNFPMKKYQKKAKGFHLSLSSQIMSFLFMQIIFLRDF